MSQERLRGETPFFARVGIDTAFQEDIRAREVRDSAPVLYGLRTYVWKGRVSCGGRRCPDHKRKLTLPGFRLRPDGRR